MDILESAPAEILEQAMYGEIEVAIKGHLTGRVKVMGISWAARLCIPDPRYTLPLGTSVLVLGRRGNTLLVLPHMP